MKTHNSYASQANCRNARNSNKMHDHLHHDDDMCAVWHCWNIANTTDSINPSNQHTTFLSFYLVIATHSSIYCKSFRRCRCRCFCFLIHAFWHQISTEWFKTHNFSHAELYIYFSFNKNSIRHTHREKCYRIISF